MQFSDSANKQGLVEDIDFWVGTDSTSYPIAQKTRNINNWYDKAVTLILKSDGRWEWDDNNKTDLPIATAQLNANQQDYGISGATFLKLLKVEIKDQAGNWKVLSPISLDDHRNESTTDYQKTAGTPNEYDKIGNSIFLYPKPSYTLAAALKVFAQRNVDKFVAGDTTKVPGFAEIFHRYLSMGPALDYAIANDMAKKINILTPLITKMEADIVDFYSGRGRDEKITLKLDKEDYGGTGGDDWFEGERGLNWQ